LKYRVLLWMNQHVTEERYHYRVLLYKKMTRVVDGHCVFDMGWL